MMKQLEPRPRQREPAINSITDTKHPLRLILWLGVIISRLLEGSATRGSFTTCVLSLAFCQIFFCSLTIRGLFWLLTAHLIVINWRPIIKVVLFNTQ